MVANASRRANLEMFLIPIGRSYFYCIVKKINVGEKQEKTLLVYLRKGAELVVYSRLNSSLMCVLLLG